jgi:hypothetical protein
VNVITVILEMELSVQVQPLAFLAKSYLVGFNLRNLVCFPECKRCHRKAQQNGECKSGSAIDTVECKCGAGFVGDGVQCSMSKSYNEDSFLETRKTYFYWARKLEKQLPLFKEAKDAYVAAAASFTEWLYESGGNSGHGARKVNGNEPTRAGQPSKENFKTEVISRMKKRDEKTKSQDKSRMFQKIYQQLKKRKQTINNGPVHDNSGEGRGRHKQLMDSVRSVSKSISGSSNYPAPSQSWSDSETVNITWGS